MVRSLDYGGLQAAPMRHFKVEKDRSAGRRAAKKHQTETNASQ